MDIDASVVIEPQMKVEIDISLYITKPMNTYTMNLII